MMSLASAYVLEDLQKYKWKQGIIISIGIIVLIVLVVQFNFNIYHFKRYLFFILAGLSGLLLTYFYCLKQDKISYHYILFVLCATCASLTAITIYCYRRDYGNVVQMNFQERYNDIMNSSIELEDELPYRYMYWDDYTNRNMVSNVASKSSFLSTISPSTIRMYQNFGFPRKYNVSPNSPDGINEIFSVKYYVREDIWADPLVKSYSNGSVTINIYENPYALPIGFTYDNYLPMSEFTKIKKTRRGYAMLTSLIIPDEKEEEVSKILPHYDEKINGTFKKENVESQQIKHAKESSKNFSYSTNSFVSDITTNQETYAFYSVPFDEEWKAYVNGKERGIIEINGLMAVQLEKGNNHIEFHYQANRLKIGLFITLISLLLSFIYTRHVKIKKD